MEGLLLDELITLMMLFYAWGKFLSS